MEESKLEKISDYLCAIGAIMCVGAMIGGIIYVILCGVGWGIIRAFVIYVVGTLIVASSGIVLQVDISKSKQEELNKLYVQMGRSEERTKEENMYATDICDHSIKKMPQTIDKQVIRDYIKELKDEVKNIKGQSEYPFYDLLRTSALKHCIDGLEKLLKKGD